MTHTTVPKKFHLFRNCLAAGITLLALAQGLRAQDIINVPCDNAVLFESYCYSDNDQHAWHWQSECGGPVLLQFYKGWVESSTYDHVYIFDGPDPNAPILYQNAPTPQLQDLTGVLANSTGADMYMEMTSDDSYSCAGGGVPAAWSWVVGVNELGIHEEQAESFTMYPNPAVNELSIRLTSNTNGPAEIRILDVSGRVVYQNSFTANGVSLNTFDLHGLQSGNYSVVLTTPHWVKAESLQVMR